jgi:hypothetical protein
VKGCFVDPMLLRTCSAAVALEHARASVGQGDGESTLPTSSFWLVGAVDQTWARAAEVRHQLLAVARHVVTHLNDEG